MQFFDIFTADEGNLATAAVAHHEIKALVQEGQLVYVVEYLHPKYQLLLESLPYLYCAIFAS